MTVLKERRKKRKEQRFCQKTAREEFRELRMISRQEERDFRVIIGDSYKGERIYWEEALTV